MYLLMGSTIIMAGLFLFTKFIFHEISTSSEDLLMHDPGSDPDFMGPTTPTASHAEVREGKGREGGAGKGKGRTGQGRGGQG